MDAIVNQEEVLEDFWEAELTTTIHIRDQLIQLLFQSDDDFIDRDREEKKSLLAE